MVSGRIVCKRIDRVIGLGRVRRTEEIEREWYREGLCKGHKKS